MVSSAKGYDQSNLGGYPIHPREIYALPYPVLGMRIGDADPAVLVLSEQHDDGTAVWASADHAYIFTLGARIVHTIGFEHDLYAYGWADEDAGDPIDEISRQIVDHDGLPPNGHLPQYHGYVQFGNALQRQADFNSDVVVERQEIINVLGLRYRVQRVRERFNVPGWRWQAWNDFWIDPHDGLTRRSIQQLRPDSPPIRLELLHLPRPAPVHVPAAG